MAIVQETAPGVFRPFQSGRVFQTFTTANQIIAYADGRHEQVEIDVPGYETEITIGSVESWTDEELAAAKLFRTTPAWIPDGMVPDGSPSYARVDGAVVEILLTKNAPPPLTNEEKIEQVLQHVGMTRGELATALAADIAGRGRP